jgi:hypothetical protein
VSPNNDTQMTNLPVAIEFIIHIAADVNYSCRSHSGQILAILTLEERRKRQLRRKQRRKYRERTAELRI